MIPYNPHPHSRHSMHRRAKGNDYRARRIYMITMTKAAGVRNFSRLTGEPQYPPGHPLAPKVQLLAAGRIIAEQLLRIKEINSDLEIYDSVIMPDHIHFIVHVKEVIKRHLGKYLGMFKVRITQELRKLDPVMASTGASTFEENYHDRILLKRGQLDIMKKYIRDNPRRLLIKQKYPYFFQRLLGVNIGGELYDCYGNPFLLQNPDKQQVMVRSAWSDKDFDEHKRRWLAYVSHGAILVSPFISSREKIVRDEALNMGGSVIIIRKERFPERYKPEKRYFELCSEGRLLLICKHGAAEYSPELRRNEAMDMNGIAKRIADIATEKIIFTAPRR